MTPEDRADMDNDAEWLRTHPDRLEQTQEIYPGATRMGVWRRESDQRLWKAPELSMTEKPR